MTDYTPTVSQVERGWVMRQADLDREAGKEPTPLTYAAEYSRMIARIRREAKFEALQDLADNHTTRIPDILGYKVQAVFTETIWEKLDEIEGAQNE